MTFPPTAGSNNYVLTTNGAGLLSWAAPGDSTKVPLAGGTMTGLLYLSADPTSAMGAVTKEYVDSVVTSGSYVPLAGGTMTGALVNNTNSASTAINVTQSGSGYAATFMGGNVGIGTTTPGQKLSVNGRIETDAGIFFNQGSGATDNLMFAGSTSSGKVNASLGFMTAGVGSASENDGPYFLARGNLFSALATQRGNMYFSAGVPSSPAATEGSLNFYTSGLQRMIVSNTGQVGVNVFPGHVFDVDTTGDTAFVEDRTTTGVSTPLMVANGAAAANGNGAQLSFGSSSSTTSGKTVAGIAAIVTDKTNGTFSGDMFFGTSNAGATSEKMRLTSSGRLGIGTSSPASIFDIKGAQTFEEMAAGGAPVPAAGSDFIYADNSTHTLKLSVNGGAYGDILTSASSLGGTVTSVTSANSDIAVTNTTTTPTLTLNSGTGASQIVKLDSSSRLPAVDGSQLSGLNTAQFTAGILPFARGGTGAAMSPAGKGEIIYSNSTTAITSLAAGTSGYVLTSGGVGNAPTWAPAPADSTKVPLAGGTMSGLLYLSADPSSAMGAVTKEYVDTAVTSGSYLPLAGGIMTGPLVNNTNSASTALALTQAGAGYSATFMGGNVGIGTITPAAKLDVSGEVKVGSTGLACSGTTKGAIRFNTTTNVLEFCNGTAWGVFNSASGIGTPSTPPTGTGYFVLSNGTSTGDLGGSLAAANAQCLADLQSNDWLNKSNAVSRGLLNSSHVEAFTCFNGGPCNNLVAGATYTFAVSGIPASGGASITADGSSQAPNNSQNWSGSNYFGTSVTYWTNRDMISATAWNSVYIATGSYCNGFSFGRTGSSNNVDNGRWYNGGVDCTTPLQYICMVHPGNESTTTNGYFVMSSTTWNGNLGGLAGADAKCLTELTTNTNWKGYATANANGQLIASKVHAFLCASGNCSSPIANTTYNFAAVGSSSAGGASFTTAANGEGPGDSANWSGPSYFNGSYNYWTNRQTDTVSTFTNIEYDQYSNCNAFTDSSHSNNSVYGTSTNTGPGRWLQTYNTCDISQNLICFVNP